MTSVLRAVLVVFSLLFVVAVLRLVSRGRLRLKYSLLWMGLGLVLMVCAVFPGLVSTVSRALGFGLASNFVFFVALVGLLGISLSLTVIVSRQAEMIRSLVQQVALLAKRVEELERTAEGNARS